MKIFSFILFICCINVLYSEVSDQKILQLGKGGSVALWKEGGQLKYSFSADGTVYSTPRLLDPKKIVRYDACSNGNKVQIVFEATDHKLYERAIDNSGGVSIRKWIRGLPRGDIEKLMLRQRGITGSQVLVLETKLGGDHNIFASERALKKGPFIDLSIRTALENIAYLKSASVSEDMVIVGALGKTSEAEGAGDAYILEYELDSWDREVLLVSPIGISGKSKDIQVAINQKGVKFGAIETRDGNKKNIYIHKPLRKIRRSGFRKVSTTADTKDKSAEVKVDINGDGTSYAIFQTTENNTDKGSIFAYGYIGGERSKAPIRVSPEDPDLKKSYKNISVGISENNLIACGYESQVGDKKRIAASIIEGETLRFSKVLNELDTFEDPKVLVCNGGGVKIVAKEEGKDISLLKVVASAPGEAGPLVHEKTFEQYKALDPSIKVPHYSNYKFYKYIRPLSSEIFTAQEATTAIEALSDSLPLRGKEVQPLNEIMAEAMNLNFIYY